MANKKQLTSQKFTNVRSGSEQAQWNLLWQAAIEEYKALRSEVVILVDRQYSMLYWAISCVVVMLAAILNSWNWLLLQYPDLLISVFFLSSPIIVTIFIYGWSHIVIHLTHLGSYLFSIETKLSHILEQYIPTSRDTQTPEMTNPIYWEHNLWHKHGHNFINRTCRNVKWTVAFSYLLSLSFGSYLFLWRLKFVFVWISMIHAIEIVIGVFAFWAAVWFFVFRFVVHQITIAVAPRNVSD
jgi:hypothetical protein